MSTRLRAGLCQAVSILTLILAIPPIACSRRNDPEWWPPPVQVSQNSSGAYVGFDLDYDQRLDYLQRARDGYIDALYFPARDGSPAFEQVMRPGPRAEDNAQVILLLDGVSFDRIRRLRDRGLFQLFRPPTRVVSVFPTLTDPAYDAVFGTGPTPGYEAGYFDRATNDMSEAASVYLRYGNEKWATFVDYRVNIWIDAVMYLFPVGTYHKELRDARKVVDREFAAGSKQVVLYLLSTDGLGHTVAPAEADDRIGELDGWLQRMVYDYRGRLDIFMTADHGMTETPTAEFPVVEVLKAAGLHPAEHLEKPGDVAVPLFGLIDLARVHTFDQQTCERVVSALRDRSEVELIAWKDGVRIHVHTPAGTGVISADDPSDPTRFRYEPGSPDALQLVPTMAAMKTRGEMDADGFATPETWVRATLDADFPAAVPRLWLGLFKLSREQPDVIASLASGWYVGNGFFGSMVGLQGTHGGVHRRSSETFAMSTRSPLPAAIFLPDLLKCAREVHGWSPGDQGPQNRRRRMTVLSAPCERTH